MEVARVTTYSYNLRRSPAGRQIGLILLLAAAMLVVLALAMSAVSGSAGDWPNQPPPRGAPDIAPLVVVPIDAG
jgi:hypothetical protein